jgi:hypothetical protein
MSYYFHDGFLATGFFVAMLDSCGWGGDRPTAPTFVGRN